MANVIKRPVSVILLSLRSKGGTYFDSPWPLAATGWQGIAARAVSAMGRDSRTFELAHLCLFNLWFGPYAGCLSRCILPQCPLLPVCKTWPVIFGLLSSFPFSRWQKCVKR